MANSSKLEDQIERLAEAEDALNAHPLERGWRIVKYRKEAKRVEDELNAARGELAGLHETIRAERQARLEASAALINRHRDDLAEAIRDAIDALEATKPTPGFLGIQIGVTGTRDRLDTVINDLEQAVTQADRETRKFVEGD